MAFDRPHIGSAEGGGRVVTAGDLTGAIKYLGSIRGVLERASARETAVRVAAGALAKQLLLEFGMLYIMLDRHSDSRVLHSGKW